MTTAAPEKTAATAATAPAKTAESAPYDFAAAARGVKAAPMPPGTRGAPNALDSLVESSVDKGDLVLPPLPSEEVADEARAMIRSAANRRKWGSSVKIKAQPNGTFNVHFAIRSVRKSTGKKS